MSYHPDLTPWPHPHGGGDRGQRPAAPTATAPTSQPIRACPVTREPAATSADPAPPAPSQPIGRNGATTSGGAERWRRRRSAGAGAAAGGCRGGSRRPDRARLGEVLYPMSTTYNDYNRDRIGWFFGLSGWQLAVLAASALPVFICLQRGAWSAALLFTLGWVLVMIITVVPVRGRSATGWFLASTAFAVGGLTRWTRWRSKASTGRVEELAEADLPGVLQRCGGPRRAAAGAGADPGRDHPKPRRQNLGGHRAVTHPGIGMRDGHERDRQGQGLSELLDLASRTELIDEMLFMVRTVPDDGAERDLWIAQHRPTRRPRLVPAGQRRPAAAA